MMFGVGIVRQNLKFGDGVDRRLENEASIHAIKVVRTVDQEVIRLRPLTIDRVGLAVAQGSAGFGKAGREGYHARLQQTELRKIAAVQWKFENVAFADRFAETSDGGLNQLSVGLHFNLLCLHADNKPHRNGCRLIYVQHDSLLHVRLKPFRTDLQRVMADWQFEQNVCSGAIGDGVARETGFSLDRLDRRAGDRCPSRIHDSSPDASGDLLCGRGQDQQQRENGTVQTLPKMHALAHSFPQVGLALALLKQGPALADALTPGVSSRTECSQVGRDPVHRTNKKATLTKRGEWAQ